MDRKKNRTSLGQQIDAIYLQDKEIAKANAVVSELKRERSRMEARLLKSFDKEDIDGSKGGRAVAYVKSGRHPKIKDYRKFMKYVLKKRALDLLQNRVSSRAYFDRLDEGEEVPGVEIYTSIGISVRKRKK